VISIVIISKDEPALDATLADATAQAAAHPAPAEVVVVDASEGRLEAIRERHPSVRWIPFARPADVRISIPHQRNAGVAAAAGDVIVFTDAGCRPEPGWLDALAAAVGAGEPVVTGATFATEAGSLYDQHGPPAPDAPYAEECATINMAFARRAFDAVGGFDEAFQYGSDIDFSWRLVDAGFRIRRVPDAVVRADWGDVRRQIRRGYLYGRARARLYRKHPRRLRTAHRRDPMVLVYPAYVLGLPLALRWPAYLALLAIPAWRNRAGGPLTVVADHCAFGLGVLRGAVSR
jgi:glycosyltransferase involved in cell wall biosynthesis